MRRPKIYLETTMFNYYFDTERDAHADTVKLFEEVKAGRFEAYTSIYAVEELSDAPEPKRTKMLELIQQYNVTVLDPNPATEQLASVYLEQKIIPKTHRIDAAHVAIASVYGLDMILSLNFQHIVRADTVTKCSAVNLLNSLNPIAIYSPMEVVERENA